MKKNTLGREERIAFKILKPLIPIFIIFNFFLSFSNFFLTTIFFPIFRNIN